MHLSKVIAALTALAFATLSTDASPIPSSPDIPASEVHLTERSLEINDWNCKPSARHPNPVVLVHGTGANSWDNWRYYRPRLALQGYCTFALSYGQMNSLPMFYGLDKMENSAAQLTTFVDKGDFSTQDKLGPSHRAFFFVGCTDPVFSLPHSLSFCTIL